MTGTVDRLAWVAIDWGTSHLRCWAMDRDDRPLATASSDKGMGKLRPDEFEASLVELISPWRAESGPLNCIACGMVGARQGWIEAEYAIAPCPPVAANCTLAPTRDSGLSVWLIPGVCQMQPADVMRGEETQIAGFLLSNPDFAGQLCLPGTHTKWAHVANGQIHSFATCMTGDLFQAISTTTVLRHSVQTDDWDAAAFDLGVDEALQTPEATLAKLFSLRAEGLLHGLTQGSARARLSGLLIGAEIANRLPHDTDSPIPLIGADRLCDLYARALSRRSVDSKRTDPTDMTLAGLIAAKHELEKR
ncbi:2-dehydro-3-deoxygalactonokinase [Qingshengfaniella alkalisoli]|uniref:2-dehydro-3-deoxygalactonokinase n=1 Tax=Qingshengfaniella alkalisoli TaxID=2599296 RepID=A0A5B8IVG1_9RHOB|nr:2-dehydro-3-deoxygalactonokinase [Qingshengfaniella alkalisoli]QDY68851.1 2-dehydro-3-deoxygalactonokinase [Qingshengfaniella alkalisoli]